MSDLIDGSKLLDKIKKRKTDTNEVIDYFDVAAFELDWIEKYIGTEIKENELETSASGLHIACVINWVATKNEIPPAKKKVLCWNGCRIFHNSWEHYTNQDEKWFRSKVKQWAYLEPPCL